MTTDSSLMRPFFQPLLFLLARSKSDQLQKQVELLKSEYEMLRRRVPKQRIFLKADERALLLKLGKEFGPGIRQLITIVDYSTFRRWVRREDSMQGKTRKGRPRIAKVIHATRRCGRRAQHTRARPTFATQADDRRVPAA